MDQIDQLWVIVAAILVCFMQAGFLCLEAGAVRRKNSINVGAKNIYDLIISIGVFLIFGHLTMFGHTEYGLFGNPWASNFDTEDKIIILFQAIFAGTAATILSGSIAERMKFNSYLIIIVVLSICVYPVIGHWVWSDTLFNNNIAWLKNLGFQDFAGAAVVHVVGGAAALAVSIVLGPRLNRFGKTAVNMRSSDHSLSFLGLLLIWIGWFGFNGGSVLSVNDDLTNVIINTIFGGIAGGIGGRIFQIVSKENQHDVWSMISGILGGLVGITGGAIHFTNLESLIVGLIGGFIAVGGNKLLEKYEIDDVVGAIPVHLFAGIWGILAVGIFGSRVEAWNTISILERVGIQAVGIGVIICYTMIIIWGVAKMLHLKYGIRVSKESEIKGLNISEHNASTASYDMISAMKDQLENENFDHNLNVEEGTEIGEITHMYNRVVKDMNKYSSEEKALKKQIEFNNAQLKFQRDISNTLSKSSNVKEGFNKIINHIISGGRLKGIQLFKFNSEKNKITLIESGWLIKGRIEKSTENENQSWRIDDDSLNYVISTLDQKHTEYSLKENPQSYQKLINEEIKWSVTNPIIVQQSLVAVIVVFGGDQSIDLENGLDNLLSISKSLTYLFEREISNNKLKKVAKEAQRANKAKTNFLAMMSHEIRTPMNGVIGMSSLLQETKLDPEQKEYTDAIEESAAALLHIINDILDFTKFDSEGFILESYDFNLTSVIEGCLDVISPQTRKNGIELLYIIDADVPLYLSGDANRLRQVMINLLGNASKFTSNGEILLSVSLKSDQIKSTALTLQFAIKDTGIGIKENKIESLFESFTQADSSTKRKYGGTGLGLSISKRIVNMMDGEIWAKSQLGKGSTFFFTASFNEAKDKQKLINTTASSFKDVNYLQNKRALIIDDNHTNRQILSRQLTNWGMSTDTLESGNNIKSYLEQSESYDIILSDYQMPDQCGTEVSNEIYQSKLQRIPPILILSSVDKHVVIEDEDYRKEHITNILLKPIKQSKLFEHILRVISENDVTTPKSASSIKKDTSTEYLNQNIAATHPLRILVVDDNEINRRLCTIILNRAGYNADLAENGLLALEAVSHTDYDVILMDIEMPQMDGLTAMTKIRKIDSPIQHAHIIALTAAAMAGDKENCLAHGADDYLTKPINRILLIKALMTAYQKLSSEGKRVVLKVPETVSSISPDIEKIMLHNLEQIAGDNTEIIQKLISTFNEELALVVPSLDEAKSTNDFKKMKQLSHSLKPNAKLFGHHDLHNFCDALENETIKQEQGQYQPLIDGIKSATSELQVILNKNLSHS